MSLFYSWYVTPFLELKERFVAINTDDPLVESVPYGLVVSDRVFIARSADAFGDNPQSLLHFDDIFCKSLSSIKFLTLELTHGEEDYAQWDTLITWNFDSETRKLVKGPVRTTKKAIDPELIPMDYVLKG